MLVILLSDQHILSPNNPKYDDRFCQIYEDLHTLFSWVRLRGSVIQANGRLIFEDDLRSGGLLGFTTQ